MNDSIEQLVRHADDVAYSTSRITAEKLLQAAVASRRRRVARRGAGAGVTLLLAVGVAVWFGTMPETSDNPSDAVLANAGPHTGAAWSLKRPGQNADGGRSSVNVAELQRDLERLESEAALHMRIVRGLQAPATSEAEASPWPPVPSAAELVRLEAARSAAISWRYATLVEQEFDDVAAAKHEYQRVVERFPGTDWANYSIVSLQRLSATGGDAPTL